VQIETTLLKHLVPIQQLQSEHRQQMANKSHLLELSVGDELSSNEEHRWFLYLLDGKIDLLGLNQPPQLLRSEDSRANHPLFSEGERKTRLVAQTACKIIRFEKQLFNTFLDQELISGEELETIEMNDVEGNLFNEIMHAFNMGELKLPSLPEVAAKVQTAMTNPETSAEDVARIISADPAIATRLINAANGPLSRGVETIASIQSAVVRLGMQTSKELVMSFAIKQLFITKSPLLRQRMHELYDRSIEVAAISFALSKQSGKLSPDHMLLAGLLHEIGVIPLLSYIEDTGLMFTDESELDEIIRRLRGVVGSMVIRHWGLSSDFLAVVEDFENWQRDTGDELDTCDMIIVAQIYNRLKHHQVKGLPKVEQVAAFLKLYPGKQDAEFVKHVFEQAHEEIVSVMTLLKM